MRVEDRVLVRELDLFSDLREDSFARLMEPSYLQSFPAGVVLLEQGEVPHFLYLVIEGAVEMRASHDQCETIVNIVGSGSPLALSSMLAGEGTLAAARTLQTSRVLMIPAQAINDVLLEDYALMKGLLREMAMLSRNLIREVNAQKMRTSTQRLANWILHAARNSETEVAIPFQKRTLACLVGTTPENLSRSIAQLEQHGVRFKGSSVTILDHEALARYASPSAIMDPPSGILANCPNRPSATMVAKV